MSYRVETFTSRMHWRFKCLAQGHNATQLVELKKSNPIVMSLTFYQATMFTCIV